MTASKKPCREAEPGSDRSVIIVAGIARWSRAPSALWKNEQETS
ncbi:hypothetical protein trd_0630 [Thermomicrobium roseum DSM 5159]|uniref:Uncharacterized protein n=1 Tax=Thermomicrobium roseum (strain ATCC 27502 / DSM 5159 / P-2) TaxID=309801 RepID=B9KYS6_THERP|nr:hypothetical protein trd_0630 [Thermomicrobium roseum DSM 5159]